MCNKGVTNSGDVPNGSSGSNGSDGSGGSGGSDGSGSSPKKANKVQEAALGESVKGVKDQIKGMNRQYKSGMKSAKQKYLDSLRNLGTKDEWFITQTKLQNTYKNQRDANGNGAYGSGMDALNNVTRTYDSNTDTQIRNADQDARDSIYQQLYTAQQQAIDDWNNSLTALKQSVRDINGNYVVNNYNGSGKVKYVKKKNGKWQVDDKAIGKAWKKVFNTNKKVLNKSFKKDAKLKVSKYSLQPNAKTKNVLNGQYNGISDISNSSGASGQYLANRYG